MSRPLRIQYPDALYHVMCRGNERREIFRNNEDRLAFLRFLGRSLEIYSVKLYAYVLMTDHFHLLVGTPLGNLSEFMRQFNITYTGYFNRQHKRVGHLYQGRYKSILVEQEAYLAMVSRYIHLNPIRLKSLETVAAQEKFEILCQYPWSSLPGYLDPKQQKSIVDCSLVLSEFGGFSEKGRERYRRQIFADIAGDFDLHGEVFCQSILGSKGFIDQVSSEFQPGGKVREQPAARIIRQYHRQDLIFATIEAETGRNLEALKMEKGDLRRVAMELLYRHGGLKGPVVGALFGVDYSVVSQERKRLRERLVHDAKLDGLMKKLEGALSMKKI